MFDNKAVFSYEGLNDEETLEVLINADCDVDDIAYEEGLTTVFAPSTEYAKIRDALSAAMPNVNFLEDHITWIPQVKANFTEAKDIEHLERFTNMLDEIDDVQDYYHNVELPESEE
jgi:transcriptional/translational regulatory protein YebC/TACO1